MMNIVQNYKEIDPLRASFNQLANLVFGISFEQWYQKGFWNDSYKCHSIVQDDSVISNVSTTEMNLVLNGEMKKAIQLGTVMTHPKYRNRGLSDRLLKQVILKYEDKCDFIYLFPNESVMEFYPKYGFKKHHDVYYSVGKPTSPKETTSLEKVEIADDSNLRKFHDAVLSRRQTSSTFDTFGCIAVYMWHCMNDLRECIYQIAGTNDYVVLEEDDKKIHLYDVITRTGYSIDKMFELIGVAGKKEICLHFLPDDLYENDWKIQEQKNEDMFFRPLTQSSYISHQLMAHT